MTGEPRASFFSLTPDRVLDAVEVGGLRCTGRCLPLRAFEGYEVFREFDRSTLALWEPLRALRIVYMSAWIARRWDDPSFPPAFPMFRHANYWMQEYEELIRIADALTP